MVVDAVGESRGVVKAMEVAVGVVGVLGDAGVVEGGGVKAVDLGAVVDGVVVGVDWSTVGIGGVPEDVGVVEEEELVPSFTAVVTGCVPGGIVGSPMRTGLP